jgi:hypothetical protein
MDYQRVQQPAVVYQPVVYQPQQSFISELSSGLDKCGKYLGILCGIICVIIIIILFVVGSTFVKQSKKIKNNTVSTMGTIVKINNYNNMCNVSYQTIQRGSRYNRRTETIPKYTCNLSISYSIDNKNYISDLVTTDNNYSVGNTINILVDKSNPSKIYYQSEINTKESSGNYMFITGGVLTGLLVLHLLLLRYSNFYKKIVCIDMVGRIFNF